MHPQTHFLVALFLGEILVKLGILSHKAVIVCAVLAVLIDLDHWIAFMVKRHKTSFLKAWNTATIGHGDWERTFVHHKIGFLLVSVFLLIMLLFNRLVFWVVGIAYYSHMFLDYAHVIGKKKFKFKKLGFVVKITGFELALDVILVIGIILLLI